MIIFKLFTLIRQGFLSQEYKLHENMMSFVNSSYQDADVILFVTDLYEKYADEKQIDFLKEFDIPIIMVMNKIDLAKGSQADDKIAYWKELINFDGVIKVSALEKIHTEDLFQMIIDALPEHPAYFPKDELTDKPERFFVDEIIREKIFLNYKRKFLTVLKL